MSRASCFILFVLSFWKSSGCFEFSVVKWLALLVSWKLEFWRGTYHDANGNGDKKPYTRTFVSFQSTGATNIAGVDNLLSLTLYIQPKYREAKNNKFAWATKQQVRIFVPQGKVLRVGKE